MCSAVFFPEAAYPRSAIFAVTGPAHIAHRVIPTALQRIPGATRPIVGCCRCTRRGREHRSTRVHVIISSHHTAAKAFCGQVLQRHICYCHTPMRALWERSAEELEELPRCYGRSERISSRVCASGTTARLAASTCFANSATTRLPN